MSSLEESILAARERLRDRVRAFSAADAPLIDAAAGYLTTAGRTPSDVVQAVAGFVIRLVTDPEAFYDVAHQVNEVAREETQRLETFFADLLYGPNGVLQWSPLSLNPDAYSTERLQELQRLVRRGRFARSALTEEVSVDVLSAAQEAAEELANFVAADSIAKLPLQSVVRQAVSDLARLEQLLGRVTTIRGEFESADLRGFAIARVLDKIDVALERALDSFVETDEVTAATDVLASLATVEAVVEILLQDVERFGEIRVPEAVLLPDFQKDLLDVSLRALPERVRNRRLARVEIASDLTAAVTGGSLDASAFEEEVTLVPEIPRVRLGWAKVTDRLLVAGQATVQSSQEADTDEPLVTQIHDTSASTVSGNRRIFVEDASAAADLVASSSSSGDVKVIALVGDYSTGEYIPITDADDSASPNWIEIPSTALVQWDVATGTQTSASGYDPSAGTVVTFLPAIDRVSVGGYPVVTAVDALSLDESKLEVRLSLASGSSARDTWPFDEEDLEGEFGVELGYAGAETSGLKLDAELGVSDYLGAGGIQSGNAVDFSLTYVDGFTPTVILRGLLNAEAVAAQLPGRRIYLENSGTSYPRVVESASRITSDTANDAIGTVPGDVVLALSEDVPVLLPDGWCYIDRSESTRVRENQVRYFSVTAGSVHVGDVLFVAGELVSVLSVAGTLVLIDRAIDLDTDPTSHPALSAKRYRGIQAGDVFGSVEDTLRWRVTSLDDVVNVEFLGDESSVSYPVTLEDAAFVVAGGERTTRYLVQEEGTPLDLYYLDDYFRNRLSEIGTLTLAPTGPDIRWAISAGGTVQNVARLSNYICRLPSYVQTWGQTYQGKVVALSKDGSRTGIAQTLEAYRREDGSTEDVRVQGLTMLDLETDNRVRLSRGTLFEDTSVTTALTAEIPVRKIFQGPVYRGGSKSYGRWGLISYRVRRRNRAFDYEELRTEVGRAYADLGARTLDMDTGTAVFEASGVEAQFTLATGLTETQLLGLDVVVAGEDVAIPARIAEVLTYTSPTSAFVRLSRSPFEAAVSDVAVSITLKETVIAEAAREIFLAYTYLRQMRRILELSRPVARPVVAEVASQLSSLGAPRLARAAQNGKFDVLTALFETSRTSEELAETLEAVINLSSVRNETFLSNPA